jgi:tRNA-specific 2-thiouridylase
MKTHKNAGGDSDPWYVARKDVANNTLYIVQGHDHPWLLSSTLQAGQLSWVSGEAPDSGHLSAKTRYRQADMACAFDGLLLPGTETETGVKTGVENFALKFTDPQWAVTPGQSAVLYDGDICLGGGIIESSGNTA